MHLGVGGRGGVRGVASKIGTNFIENRLWNNPTWSKTLELEMYTEIEQPPATGILWIKFKQCHIRRISF